MELREISKKEDFAPFYEGNGLSTTEEKIDYLRKALKIRASRCDVEDRPADELAGLEDLVMSHLWEGLQ